MDFGARQTRVSGGAAHYKLNGLEQVCLPKCSFVSLSAKQSNSDTHLTGLQELNETMHGKGLKFLVYVASDW